MTPTESQFDTFWQAYPKRNGCKRGRKQARAQWLKLKPSPELIQIIMDWLEHDKQLRTLNRKRKQFYADPKDAFRWLKGECWEDELEPLPKKQTRLCACGLQGVATINNKWHCGCDGPCAAKLRTEYEKSFG